MDFMAQIPSLGEIYHAMTIVKQFYYSLKY